MTKLEPGIDFLQPSPRVPLEVIDRIVDLAVRPADSDEHAGSFSAIESFSLASSTFRRIALCSYMRNITPKSKRHWKNLFKFLEALTESTSERNEKRGFVWVKSISASSRDVLQAPENLAHFISLQTLSLDFYREGLSTQQTRISRLCRPAAFCYLTSLTITHLPRIDTPTLLMVAHAFPELINLYLSCVERLEHCCWCCYEESLEDTIHSPIPEMFSSAKSLARAFAGALQPLTKLTYLFLGIFLSDEMLPYRHIQHCSEMMEEQLPPCLINICAICEKELETMKIREDEANCVFARRFEALRSVRWASFVNHGHGELFPPVLS